MQPALPPQGPSARNPVARSLALAVLSVAMVVAVVMGAVVFAVLLGIFVIGYAVMLVNRWRRNARIRRRMATMDASEPVDTALEASYEVVEVAVEPASRGPGASI